MSPSRTAAAALLGALILCPAAALALEDPQVAPAPQEASTFGRTAAAARADLDKSLRDLAALREEIAREKIPLATELGALERRLSDRRGELESLMRRLDERNLEIGNQQSDLKARQDEKAYLSNLLGEYVRNLETRVHISELQRYRQPLEQARLAADGGQRPPAEVFRLQTDVVRRSLERLADLSGGGAFDGTAVGEDGLVREGRFVLVGPLALFASRDGRSAGLAEQRLGSLEPNLLSFEDPGLSAEVRRIVEAGTGTLPFDPSLGNARKIEETEESLVQHILKGGPVMAPILLLALAALVVAVCKWVQVARVRTLSRREVEGLIEALERRDYAGASSRVEALGGPAGEMLRAGLEHLHEPKELVEEVMFERLLETRLRLQKWLSFVAMSASAAPLLGLLGTVTGMITTFKLITVFGSGDPRTLSSGISEALITTEYGLIVAIPSLLLYAWLSRRVRGLVDGMEKIAVSFLNRISTAEAVQHRLQAMAGVR
jgi:biopolymer transport protein ExbB